MAPHNFWMKRQLSGLPDLGDILSIPSVPTPSSSTATSTRSLTSTSLSTSQSTRSTASSTSTPAPARPTQSTIVEEEEEEPVESQVDTSPTPTSEAILVTPAPVPSAQVTDSIVTSARPSTSFFVSSSIVVVDGAAPSSGVAQVGAAKGNAFLDNKVLSGVVFAICGIVGLLIIGAIIWIATRKARQTKKLEQEIISWDPDHVRGFNNANATTHASKDAETRSFEEKGGPGSLESHFTYTLPSQNMHAQPKPAASGPYSDYYGAQRPIQVTLPRGEGQPYRAKW